MKSSIWYAFMIAMLLVSTVAFGEIVVDGDCDSDKGGGGTSDPLNDRAFVTAEAEGGNTMSWGYASGWETWYTTESGVFDWEYHALAWGDAYIYFVDVVACYSLAYAEVNCYSPDGSDDTAYQGLVLIDQDDYEGEPIVRDFYGVESHDGYDATSLDAYDSVDGDYLIGAQGAITTGSDDSTYSEAEAKTDCRMW